MKVLSIFSGIGGFELGLERAGGFHASRFIEKNAYCRAVLAKHWPDVPQHDDVTTYEFREGEADVITGGFPCQDLSHAGSGAGLSGERSGLYRELVRAFRVVRPRLMLMENVAALLGRGLGVVLGDLAESGADVEWDCVPASAVRAPHIRDRIWIVAHAQHSDADRERSHRAPGDDGATESGDEQGGDPGSVREVLADADGRQQERSERGLRPGRRATGVGGEALADPGGEHVAVADTLRVDGDERGACDAGEGAQGRKSHRSRKPKSLADADGQRLSERPADGGGACGATGDDPRHSAERGVPLAIPDSFAKVRLAVSRGEQDPWEPEPDVGRVVARVPSRVDRLSALGNALVPKIPYLIGQAIQEQAR